MSKRKAEAGRAYDARGNVRPADARWLAAPVGDHPATDTGSSDESGPTTPPPVKSPATGTTKK